MRRSHHMQFEGGHPAEERQHPNERPEGQHQTTLYNVTEDNVNGLDRMVRLRTGISRRLAQMGLNGYNITRITTVPTTTEGPQTIKKSRSRRPKVEQMPPPEGQTLQKKPQSHQRSRNCQSKRKKTTAGRGAADPPAKTREPEAGIPALPGEGFFDKLAAVTNWEDNQLWVYRVEPITDRLGQGKAKFIRIWAEACDENKIMFAEGSGVYSLLWKQRPAGGGPLVHHAKYERLEIENKDFPPRIEPGDWLEDHGTGDGHSLKRTTTRP